MGERKNQTCTIGRLQQTAAVSCKALGGTKDGQTWRGCSEHNSVKIELEIYVSTVS